jgi:hypothetical protein
MLFFSRIGAREKKPAWNKEDTSGVVAVTGVRAMTDNPKTEPQPGSNTIKDPEDWVSGDEPMTGAQSSYLKTLSEEAGDQGAWQENLTKAEASRRIDELKKRLGR